MGNVARNKFYETRVWGEREKNSLRPWKRPAFEVRIFPVPLPR